MNHPFIRDEMKIYGVILLVAILFNLVVSFYLLQGPFGPILYWTLKLVFKYAKVISCWQLVGREVNMSTLVSLF